MGKETKRDRQLYNRLGGAILFLCWGIRVLFGGNSESWRGAMHVWSSGSTCLVDKVPTICAMEMAKEDVSYISPTPLLR